MLNVAISTFAQVLFALLISIGVWAFFGRRRFAFSTYVGLKPAPRTALLIGVSIGTLSTPVLLVIPGMLEMAGGASSVAAGLPTETRVGLIAAILLTAVFKTSFAEELIFRGLIAKSLIRRFGFNAGNVAQALVFGFAHLLMLLIPTASTMAIVTLVAFTSVTGWLNGWMKEKLAGGSILPGWAAHGAANTIAYSVVAFNLY